MADHERLNAVLQKLGRGDPLPVPDSASAQDVLTGLLRAIDETVLPRDLIVEGGGDPLILHVAKRRLLAVSGAIDAELAESQSQQLTDLGSQIARFLVGQSIGLRTQRPETAPDPSAIGASVGALAEAWAAATTGQSGLEDMAEKALAAIIWREGQETARSGDQDLLGPASIDRDALRTLNTAKRGAVCLTAEGAGASAVFVWDDLDEALLVVPSDEAGPIFRDWLNL